MERRDFLKTLGISSVAMAGLSFAPSLWKTTEYVLAQQPAGVLGKIVITLTPAAKIHTYIAPEDSARVTSHIIESENKIVIVDAQLVPQFGLEVKNYAESLGKPLDRIILSHDHPDHWTGAINFDVPLVTTDNVVTNLQGGVDIGQYQLPEGFQMPQGGLQAGTEMIDNLTYEFSIYNNAEAIEQVVIRIPEANTVILQDLMYNNTYFFPGLDRPNWITILEDLRTTLIADKYETVLVGHGVPTTLGILDTGLEYLAFLEEQFNAATSVEEAVAAIQSRYPSYHGAFLLSFYPTFFPQR
jgi:glyoxylase-like metal-dependent hydrolase (beta-lactamase superfamily II)